jgi:hypothetical protein
MLQVEIGPLITDKEEERDDGGGSEAGDAAATF